MDTKFAICFAFGNLFFRFLVFLVACAMSNRYAMSDPGVFKMGVFWVRLYIFFSEIYHFFYNTNLPYIQKCNSEPHCIS